MESFPRIRFLKKNKLFSVEYTHRHMKKDIYLKWLYVFLKELAKDIYILMSIYTIQPQDTNLF